MIPPRTYPKANLIEATTLAVYNDQGKQVSKGSKDRRLVLQDLPDDHYWISLASFPKLSMSLMIFPNSAYIPLYVQLSSEQQPTEIMVSVSSVAKRFGLSKETVRSIAGQSGDAKAVRLFIRFAKEKEKFMTPKQQQEDSEEDGALLRSNLCEMRPLADIAQIARQERRDLRLSSSVYPLENSVHITQDLIATDDRGFFYQKFWPERTFKGSVTPDGQQLMRETIAWTEESERRLAIFERFKDKAGILAPLSICKYENKYGMRKAALFYSRFDKKLSDWLQDGHLTQKERYDIALQLLIGLKNLNEEGCHNRLSSFCVFMRLISTHDTSQGKERKFAVKIGELHCFRFHKEKRTATPFDERYLEKDASAPELLSREFVKLAFPKVDVWNMGLIFFRLFQTTMVSKEFLHFNFKVYKLENPSVQVAEKPRDEYLKVAGFPPAVEELVRGMVALSPLVRWSAQQCLQYFTKHIYHDQVFPPEEEKN